MHAVKYDKHETQEEQVRRRNATQHVHFKDDMTISLAVMQRYSRHVAE